MLAVTEIVVVNAVAAVVAISVTADDSRWSESVAVVAFQLLKWIESTYIIVEVDLGVHTTVHVLPMPAAAGEYY